MKSDDFDYNTSRERLVLPEYGRNVQKLVRHLATIDSKEERNRYVSALIQVMGNLNPHLRDINDFKHKLWDHLAIISDFKFDIDSPYPLPTLETISEKPKNVPYGTTNPYFKHYGKNIDHLIAKACSMDDGQDRKDFTVMIANLMKRFYLVWNKEAVADEIIFKDLKAISRGQINLLNSDVKLEDTRDILYRNQKKNPTPTNFRSQQGHGGGHQGGGHQGASGYQSNNNNSGNYKKRY